MFKGNLLNLNQIILPGIHFCPVHPQGLIQESQLIEMLNKLQFVGLHESQVSFFADWQIFVIFESGRHTWLENNSTHQLKMFLPFGVLLQVR